MLRFLFLISVLMNVCYPAFSQCEEKFAHVNMTNILDQYPVYDSINRIFQKEVAELSEILEQMEVEINSKADSLQRFGNSLPNEEMAKHREQLIDMQDRMEKYRAESRKQLQIRNEELNMFLLKRVNKAIESVASERNILFVFDLSQGNIAYTDAQTINLDNEVLKELRVPIPEK